MNIDNLDSVQVGIFMQNVRRSTLIQDKDINNVMSIDSVQKVKAKEEVDWLTIVIATKKVIQNTTEIAVEIITTHSPSLNQVLGMMMRRRYLKKEVNLIMIQGKGDPDHMILAMTSTPNTRTIFTMTNIVIRKNEWMTIVNRHHQIETLLMFIRNT